MKYRVVEPMVVDGIVNEIKVPTALDNGFVLKFIKEREGISFFDIINAYSVLLGRIVCLNDKQVEALEKIAEADAEPAEEEKEEKKTYNLDPSKKYDGDEGIDYIILYLQNCETLSDKIKRDDSKQLFVDLGGLEMFPDANKVDWIMKLNSRIPIKTAVSVGCREFKGKKHLGIVLHEAFV